METQVLRHRACEAQHRLAVSVRRGHQEEPLPAGLVAGSPERLAYLPRAGEPQEQVQLRPLSERRARLHGCERLRRDHLDRCGVGGASRAEDLNHDCGVLLPELRKEAFDFVGPDLDLPASPKECFISRHTPPPNPPCEKDTGNTPSPPLTPRPCSPHAQNPPPPLTTVSVSYSLN